MTRLHTVLLTTTALAALGLASAVAGPNGANVVGGAATVHGQGSASVTINQSSERAVINWRQFDIGPGETTRFNQPSSSSVTLNRVTGGLGPSQIDGTLSANGRVFVVNRDGILFGPNSRIDTAGFLATTNDIRNDDFMAGRYHFNIPGRPDASIVNHGTITAHSAGFAALVAPGVRNTGTITATLGTVGLASGNGFTLDFYGDRLITLAVGDSIGTTVRDVQTGQPLNSLVENAGRIQANGGRVELTAVEARRVVDSVINNRGVIEATTVGTRGGTIVLGAATTRVAGAPRQTVRVGGTLSAAAPKGTKNAKIKDGSGEGGRVIVTGENIEVAGARIDVSGPARGGTVLIGGDWGGGNPNSGAVSHANARLENQAIPTAATVTVDSSTVIDASATEHGNAGKVIVWADNATSFRGNILATGGQHGGDGGFVEVSGHRFLDYRGRVDLRAPMGTTGTLLLDPWNVSISTRATQSGGFDANGVWTGNDNGSNINTTDLVNQLGMANVVVTTNGTVQNPGTQPGDITVENSFSWTGNNSLTFSAHGSVQFNDNVIVSNTGAGNFIVRADSQGNGIGTISFNPDVNPSRVDWSNSTGRVSFYYNPPNGYTSPIDFTPNGQGTGNGVITNPGVQNQFTAYMLVNNPTNLQDISTNLGGTYALGNNIDLINTPNFTPLGAFTGVLDGNGGVGPNRTIDNLTISSSAQTVGLFSNINAGGIVRNLSLTNANVIATGNNQLVGTLVGDNSGTIANVVVGGTVNGGIGTGITAGGIAGINRSFNSITESASSVNVTVGDGMNVAGGLVGLNAGAISGSSASGNVAGGANSFVGGLVGFNGNPLHPDPAPTITSSSATGNVTTTSNGFAGGLVGTNSGAISLSSANANVIGGASSSLGGLVGMNVGAISNSQAAGPVSASGGVMAGGLVGDNDTGATISGSNASGNVTITVAGAGDVFAGGLVGNNSGAITNSHATGNVAGTGGDSSLGGLVGAVGFGATIDTSSATGNVTLTTTFLANAGGLAGASGGTISNSQASGNVTLNAGSGQVGGLVGMNVGTIGNSSASVGTVTGNGANTFAGGLVGQNGIMGPNPMTGTITNSSAGGNVNINGLFSMAGGLAGANAPGSTITNSRASGNVTSTANGTDQNDFTSAGGLVGQNAGTIEGTTTPSQATPCAAGQSCATGTVTVGAHGQGGGLAGTNFGTITNSFARGAVTTAVDGAGMDANTHLGGLTGLNQGTITDSFASGNVGDPNNPRAFVMAGGLVSDNAGTILRSFASGNVVVGDNGQAGGLSGANHPFEGCQNCPGPFGTGQNNAALIANSQASGTVTGGSASVVGGFVGSSGGTLNSVSASGAVTVADNSIAGGLVGAADFGNVITQSSATGAVSSTGQISFVGGLAGLNIGAITSSTSSGAVSATDLSAVGGLVGVNLGSITQSTTPATATVTAPGLGNVVGGLVGVNAGTIQQNSNAAGAVTGGMLSSIGGLVGANIVIAGPNVPPGNPIPGSSFPAGTITDSVATGDVSGGPVSFVGGQVGSNGGVLNNLTSANNVSGGDGSIVGGLVALNSGPLFLPPLPAAVEGCALPTCGALQDAQASTGPGTIMHSSSSSAVTGGAGSFVGGLVGWNLFGGISESNASGPVTGGAGSVAGGLVALNLGAIGTSSSSGPVTVGDGGIAGGLVGLNLGVGGSASVAGLQAVPGAPAQAVEIGAIRQSFSTSAVTGGAGSTVAGLVAANGGLLDQTYAIGLVQGGAGSTTGGLIAINSGAFTIPPEFGGGNQLPTLGGTVTSSYWDPNTTGQQTSAAGSVFPPDPLPPGFDPTVWIGQAGTYPCILGSICLPRVVPPLDPTVPDVPGGPAIDDLIRNILPPANSLVVANLTQTTNTNPTTQGEVVNTTQATQTTQTTQNQPRGNQRPQGNQQGTNGPLRPDGRPSNIPPLNETRFINDQVVVQIGAGVSPDVLNRIARRLGLSVIASETLGLLGTRVIQFRIGSGRSVREVLLELEKQRIVDEATPNYEFTLAQNTTTDPPAGDAAQYMIAKLNLAAAHRIATGDNVLIAVIDSEIDSKHPDLEGRIANRFDAVGPADKPHPHGTGMAGAIASHKKLMGTAPGARILAIRAFGTGSGGSQGTTVQIVKGLDWAISQGAKIVNMSFAGPKDPTLAKAFKAAADRKVVLIAAAGNAGPKSPPLFPGAETGVIAVTATDADDAVYTNANRGKYIAVAAPGVDILVPAPDGSYEFTTGTSVAAAHVSGVAALLLQRDPKLDPATVREILTSTARQLGKTQGGRNDETGSGLVDPLKALQSLGARSAGVTTPGVVAQARN